MMWKRTDETNSAFGTVYFNHWAQPASLARTSGGAFLVAGIFGSQMSLVNLLPSWLFQQVNITLEEPMKSNYLVVCFAVGFLAGSGENTYAADYACSPPFGRPDGENEYLPSAPFKAGDVAGALQLCIENPDPKKFTITGASCYTSFSGEGGHSSWAKCRSGEPCENVTFDEAKVDSEKACVVVHGAGHVLLSLIRKAK